MKNKIRTCDACPYPLEEGLSGNWGISVPGRKVKGKLTYRKLCRECYQIWFIVQEREEQKRKKKTKK